MLNHVTDIVRKHISNGDAEGAINEFKKYAKDIQSFMPEIMLLESRLERLKKANREGVITKSDFDLEINRINKSIIEIVALVESKTDTTYVRLNKKRKNILYVAILPLTILLFTSLYWLQQKSHKNKINEQILQTSNEALDISKKILLKNQEVFLEIFKHQIDKEKIQEKSISLFHYQEYKGQISKVIAELENLDTLSNLNSPEKDSMRQLLYILVEMQQLIYETTNHGLSSHDSYRKKIFDELERKQIVLDLRQEIYFHKFGIVDILNSPHITGDKYTTISKILIDAYLNQLREYHSRIGSLTGYFSAIN